MGQSRFDRELKQTAGSLVVGIGILAGRRSGRGAQDGGDVLAGRDPRPAEDRGQGAPPLLPDRVAASGLPYAVVGAPVASGYLTTQDLDATERTVRELGGQAGPESSQLFRRAASSPPRRG